MISGKINLFFKRIIPVKRTFINSFGYNSSSTDHSPAVKPGKSGPVSNSCLKGSTPSLMHEARKQYFSWCARASAAWKELPAVFSLLVDRRVDVPYLRKILFGKYRKFIQIFKFKLFKITN